MRHMWRALRQRAGMAMAATIVVGGSVLSAGCVFEDNGSTFSGSNVGRSVTFSGLAQSPGEQIKVQILNPATANPAVTGNWLTLATVNAANTPFDLNGTPTYSWSTSVVPVPAANNDGRWKPGGLARFRVLNGNNIPLVTFDDSHCWLDAAQAGASPLAIYTACASHASPVLTFVDKDPLPNYTGHLSFRASGDEDEGADYNDVVNAPDTLGAWKTSRGFPTGEIVARYYNRGDLGIGREMHCRKQANAVALNKPDVACYVSNYGSTDDGLADAETALAAAIAGHAPFATVAMDYWSGSAHKVRFYTYDANGNVLTAAKLDSGNAKTTPGICLNCHGGTYDFTTHTVSGAAFLPFDLENFGFIQSNGGFAQPGQIYTKASQQDAFRQLNSLVRDTQPPAAIVELIEGWYGGVAQLHTPGTPQDPTFVPAGWAADKVTYAKAIAPYCRTCHMALATSSKPAIHFATKADMAASPVEAFVCSSHNMPHAEVTRALFWSSSARAHLSGTFGFTQHCN